MELKMTFISEICTLIKLNFFKFKVDSTFTSVNSNGGKFLEKDYYYEKEKGTLNKVSFLWN